MFRKNQTQQNGDQSINLQAQNITLVQNNNYSQADTMQESKSKIPDKYILDLKDKYLKMLETECEYMDLGGISPRIGNKILKIKMEDLFINLRFIEKEVLHDSFHDYLEENSTQLQLEFELLASTADDHNLVALEHEDTPSPSEIEIEEDDYFHNYNSYFYNTISLINALKSSRVVILGHPGYGKTTIGKYIAHSICQEKLHLVGTHLANHIPIIVKAAEYAMSLKEHSSYSFYEHITKKHTVHYGPLFEWALERGLGLIIIDGLDEIPDVTHRILTSKRIEKFVSEFSNNKFIITSRIVGYRQNKLTGNFKHLTLTELSPPQIFEFLKQWYSAIENETDEIGKKGDLQNSQEKIKSQAKELLQAIQSNPGVSKLANNPLLLTIIAIANWNGRKLPNKRVDLYQIATETLIENWPLKQRGQELDYEENLSLLEPVAHYILSSGKNNLITEIELQPLFMTLVSEIRGASKREAKHLSKEILHVIEEETGFFLQKGFDAQGKKVHGFLHQTFAEYLSARHLAEIWSEGEFDFSQYIHNPNWHEVLLLMAGHIGTWATGQSTRLVNDILNIDSDYENYLCRDLLFAAEVLADNVRVKRDLQYKITYRMINIALQTPHIRLFHTLTKSLSNISKVFPFNEQIYAHLEIKQKEPMELQIRKAIISKMVGFDSDGVSSIIYFGLTCAEKIVNLITPFLFQWADETGDSPCTLLWISKNTVILYKISKSLGNLLIKEGKASNLTELPIKSCKVEYGQLFTYDERDLSLDFIINLYSSCTNESLIQEILGNLFLTNEEYYIRLSNELLGRLMESITTEEKVIFLELLKIMLSEEEQIIPDIEIQNFLNPYIDNILEKSQDKTLRKAALHLKWLLVTEDEEIEELFLLVIKEPDEEIRLIFIDLMLRYLAPLTERYLDIILSTLPEISNHSIRLVILRVLMEHDEINNKDFHTLLKNEIEYIRTCKNTDDIYNGLKILFLTFHFTNSEDDILKLLNEICSLIQERIELNEESLNLLMNLRYFLPSRAIAEYFLSREFIMEYLSHTNLETRLIMTILFSFNYEITLVEENIRYFIQNSNNKDAILTCIKILKYRDYHNIELLDILLSLMFDDEETSNVIYEVLSSIRNEEYRQYILAQLPSYIEKKPDNKNAFNILWEFVLTPDIMDDLPF
ncbi:NACHT domain-containing protein [Aneurinibacillus soli]|uniref:NACHT domain protein n=1 Tax=Aneurinibacillus soli TaxID=1500254 RepID=A0A0U5BE61_9BACL|nr:NACHT domain-containing protein [Aneurinibacillus soli]PYE62952.1 NACHT domain-containing protein [Aneurinibacillus soli]BAU28989.1 NACHT domain protein [Aneurinibacillus soli]